MLCLTAWWLETTPDATGPTHNTISSLFVSMLWTLPVHGSAVIKGVHRPCQISFILLAWFLLPLVLDHNVPEPR
jgi:hypothetical protein